MCSCAGQNTPTAAQAAPDLRALPKGTTQPHSAAPRVLCSTRSLRDPGPFLSRLRPSQEATPASSALRGQRETVRRRLQGRLWKWCIHFCSTRPSAGERGNARSRGKGRVSYGPECPLHPFNPLVCPTNRSLQRWPGAGGVPFTAAPRALLREGVQYTPVHLPCGRVTATDD